MQRVLLFFSVFACFGILAGAVMYLKLMPVQEVEAAQNTVSCQTKFDRPLLFGVGPDSGGGALTRVPAAGATLTTLDFPWPDIQPSKNELKLDYMDFAVGKWQDTGLVIVGGMSRTPQWAQPDKWVGFDQAKAQYKAQPNDNPETEVAFRTFVRSMVLRYKDRIHYWTYWNEPNGCGSNIETADCRSDQGTARAYIKWANIFYDEVKKADSNAVVLGGNLDWTSTDTNYIRFMNDRSAQYDVLVLHPYDKNSSTPFANTFQRVKLGYEAQQNKRPVWLGEWGFDQGWWGGDKPENQEKVKQRIQEAFNILKLPENNWVQGAIYHNIRDEGGTYGLMGEGDILRIHGEEFKRQALTICNPSFGTGSASTALPTAAGGNNITVRSYFAASAQSVRPRVSMFLNNAAGFVSATSANDPTPNDTLPCDGSVAGPQVKCGGLNLYKEKLIEDFEVTTDAFVKDVVIPADKLVYLTGDGLGFTKLSYVFHNRDNNAVGVTKIEFYAPDGKLILTYAPQKGSQQYTVTPNQGSRALEKFYFDLGQVSNSSSDNYGMVKAFDKISLQPKNDNDDYWTLSDEGSFNLVSVGIHKAIVNAYGGLSEPACVVASNDIGGIALKRGIPVTLSSVASVPIKNFRFSFYNPDNRDPNNNNSPKAFCVKGASPQTGDGCPAGSGQLVVDIASSINGSGAIQATDWFLLPNEQLLQSTWRGDMSWNRPIPYDPSTLGNPVSVSWNFSSYLSNITTIGSFKPTAEIDALDTFYGVFGKDIRDKKLTMEIWRNNQLWTTTAGFISTGSYIDWNTATPWTKVLDLNEKPADLPGTGQVTATGSFIAGNTLWQVYWRGTEEWIRSVAYSTDGKPNFSAANKLANKGYTLNRNISTLPGSVTASKVQAISFMQNSASRTIQEQIWINNSSWKRTIPQGPNQVDAVDFAKASSYAVVSDTPPGSNQSASTLVAYNTINQPDVNNGNKVPVNLQVNATFTTTNGKEIGNQGACVTWFTIDKSIQGDVNGDCVNDIYDYNLLLQHFETNNCQYNLVGDCRIDQNDLDDFKNRYGQSCPQ